MPEVGDRVTLRDPKLKKSVAGHGPGHRPPRGPMFVTEARGGKVWLADAANPLAGTVESHADNLCYLPEEIRDYERSLPEVREPITLTQPQPDARKSMGQLIERRDEAAPKVAPAQAEGSSRRCHGSLRRRDTQAASRGQSD